MTRSDRPAVVPVPGRGVSRRRMITLTMAAAALSPMPLDRARPSTGEAALVGWQGVMLGAVATLRLHHRDRAEAERLIAAAVAEARRLEGLFSLYRDDSVLAELNRTGVVVAPPREFADLLEQCDEVVRLTGGAFDPTVQPLWRLHVDHFTAKGRDAGPPPAAAVAAALALVGWDKVRAGRDRVVLSRRGMALTLNGIAQGYVTDRVVALLRDAGVTHSLVDMGEIRAIGDRPDHRPWTVALETAGAGEPARRLALVDRAVATSAAAGFSFDAFGRCNHLFDPRTGTCASAGRAVSVVAPTATTADALSTAFSLMTTSEIAAVLRRRTDVGLCASSA